ncbi:hypothetical protein CIPAW_16G000400 [Carya illinoinensis]|uniref:Uncharacterized protein n=1 Tax=Carya illinoinensis TaxID=32201 RepID=A0A8T1N4C0_CARIL|nr:hypothetical protein CIPAW_16G000400 [Carya illinoinensis]
MDLPLVEGDFIWSNSQGWSRLDRFHFSPSWEAHFPKLCQKRLSHVCSDHFPILLDYGGIHGGRLYFKFENMWLATDSFVENVRS